MEAVPEARDHGVVAGPTDLGMPPHAEHTAGDLLFIGDEAVAEGELAPDRRRDFMSEGRDPLRLAAEAAG